MRETALMTVNCPKCGKEILAASEEDAKEKLRAHDQEMHEGKYETECEKGA